MSGRAVVATVARREIVERVRQRSFLISTLITLLLVAAAAVVPGLLGGDGPERYEVAAPTAQDRAIVEAARAAQADFDVEIEVAAPRGTEQIDRSLEDEKIDAAVQGTRLVTLEDAPADLEQALQAGNRSVRGAAALRERGVSGAGIRRALAPTPLRKVSRRSEGDDDAKRGVAFALTLLLYGQLLTYGLWVATGVVEEKASRVIEVLLSAIAPRDLLAGKVLGLGALALGQLTLTVVVGAVLARVSGVLDVSGDILSTVGIVLLWFPLGYALYACLYAAAGALVSRQEDIQTTTTPLTILIIAGYLISFQVLDDPDGTLARVASLVPLFAPLLMPVRMAVGEASATEAVAAAVLLVLSIGLVMSLGARIYERAVLRMGKPVGLGEALRARAR